MAGATTLLAAAGLRVRVVQRMGAVNVRPTTRTPRYVVIAER